MDKIAFTLRGADKVVSVSASLSWVNLCMDEDTSTQADMQLMMNFLCEMMEEEAHLDTFRLTDVHSENGYNTYTYESQET